MKSLTETKLTKTVLGAVDDTEKTRYQVLAILQKYHQAFKGKELYPYLADLVEAYGELNHINKQEEQITADLKKKQKVAEIDLVNEIIKHEEITTDQVQENIHDLFYLTDWALPQIEDLLEEGKEVYEYTSDKIDIDWVNLISRYLDEGYLIISTPDWASEPSRNLQAFSYTRRQISVKSDDKYHTLRLTPKEIPTDSQNPEKIKEELLAGRSDRDKSFHQNPATILATASVPYSFQKTVFPITKRKLMRWLKEQEATETTALQKT